jgi:anti-anti-sigma regulatory factor
MNITVERAQGKVPVTILKLQGELDASNYQDVIAKAREAYTGGARYLLIDMRDTPYMGSSGLVALHSIALMMRGEQPPDPESGWSAFHALSQDKGGAQSRVKLLGVQPRVERTLEMTGLKSFFEVHSDPEAAIASFEAV